MRKTAFILVINLAATLSTLLACAGPEPTPTITPPPTAMVISPTRTPIPTATPIPTPTSTPLPEPTPTAVVSMEKTPERPMVERQGEALNREAVLAFDQGTELMMEGRSGEAAEQFRKAIQAQGATSWVLEYHAAVALQQNGDTEAAIPHLTNAAGIRDNAELRARRAVLLLQQHNCGAALRDALEALRMERVPGGPDFSPEAEANWVAAVCRKQARQGYQALGNARAALEAGYESTGRFHAILVELEYAPTPLPPPGPLDPTPEPPPTPRPTPGGATQQRELPPDEIARQLSEIENLPWLSQNRPQAADAIAQISWVRDGMNEMERELAAEIALLFKQENGLGAIPVLQVRFLENAQEGDLEAVRSLRRIRERSPQDYRDIMERMGTGMGDGDTPRIALLQAVHEREPELAWKILEPETIVMNQTTRAYKTGRVRLAVVIPDGNQDEARNLLDELGEAVREVTALMQEPLEHRMVTLLVTNTQQDEINGTNFGDGIIIRPPGPRGPVSKGHIIAHEVAHYYWRGN